MRVVLVSVGFLVALSGCGIAQRQAWKDDIERTYYAEKAECERQYPDKYRKPVTPRVRCLNLVVLKQESELDRWVRLPGHSIPYMDLLMALTSRILVIAEKYDNGQLTQVQYDADVNAAVAEYTTQLFQRTQAKLQTRALQSAADSVSAPPRSTTCIGGGNMVTCY